MSFFLYRLLADSIVLIHLSFVVFVAAGGLLALRWPKLVYLHLPALAWGAFVEFSGAICPLTPLENVFRKLADLQTYEGGFIDQYITPILYPTGLTREIQVLLGTMLVVANVIIYGIVIWRARRRRRA